FLLACHGRSAEGARATLVVHWSRILPLCARGARAERRPLREPRRLVARSRGRSCRRPHRLDVVEAAWPGAYGASPIHSRSGRRASCAVPARSLTCRPGGPTWRNFCARFPVSTSVV